MKYLAPALLVFSFACFTSPDGAAIWLQQEHVVAILRPAGDCAPGAQTKITLANGNIVCVSEDRNTVVKRIDDAK